MTDERECVKGRDAEKWQPVIWDGTSVPPIEWLKSCIPHLEKLFFWRTHSHFVNFLKPRHFVSKIKKVSRVFKMFRFTREITFGFLQLLLPSHNRTRLSIVTFHLATCFSILLPLQVQSLKCSETQTEQVKGSLRNECVRKERVDNALCCSVHVRTLGVLVVDLWLKGYNWICVAVV